MSRSAVDYLHHILDEIQYLLGESANLEKDQFMADETLKRAFVRSLEIVGEATKNVDEVTRLKYPHITWRAMAGMRDRLIHDYVGVDYDIVWDVVKNKLPVLQTELEQIVREMP
jgi:uncharacterized protein with HEPN domain